MAKKERKPKSWYRSVCTVPGCSFTTELQRTERAAGRSYAQHAIPAHSTARAVDVLVEMRVVEVTR
jgi:hypothetical protein